MRFIPLPRLLRHSVSYCVNSLCAAKCTFVRNFLSTGQRDVHTALPATDSDIPTEPLGHCNRISGYFEYLILNAMFVGGKMPGAVSPGHTDLWLAPHLQRAQPCLRIGQRVIYVRRTVIFLTIIIMYPLRECVHACMCMYALWDQGSETKRTCTGKIYLLRNGSNIECQSAFAYNDDGDAIRSQYFCSLHYRESLL